MRTARAAVVETVPGEPGIGEVDLEAGKVLGRTVGTF